LVASSGSWSLWLPLFPKLAGSVALAVVDVMVTRPTVIAAIAKEATIRFLVRVRAIDGLNFMFVSRSGGIAATSDARPGHQVAHYLPTIPRTQEISHNA
jgi:hypothetical protein